MSYSDYSDNIRKMQGANYFSQAGQDLFVLKMLGNKKHGIYMEIGGADPFESNNTFLLEKDFEWKGFSIEFDSALASRYNTNRINTCFCEDATVFDYHKAAKSFGFSKNIDYLSIDIDPAENTWLALKKIPFDRYRFSVITYEHDAYVSGEKYANLSREFLISHGYKLVAKNVKCFNRIFEDWWVDPLVIPESLWSKYLCDTSEFSAIFEAA